MSNQNITNRGTGAGGANTNKNGLPYEEFTDSIVNQCYFLQAPSFLNICCM